MTKEEYRKFLLDRDGAVNEKELRDYLIKNSDPLYDIEEQKKVLQRMEERGCRKCEINRQKRWIAKLDKGLD